MIPHKLLSLPFCLIIPSFQDIRSLRYIHSQDIWHNCIAPNCLKTLCPLERFIEEAEVIGKKLVLTNLMAPRKHIYCVLRPWRKNTLMEEPFLYHLIQLE